MTVVQNNSLPENKKIEQAPSEKEVKSTETVPPNPAATEESKEDRNWKRFREERERERKLLEETKRRAEESEKQAAALKAALEAVTNRSTQSHEPIVEDEEEQKIQRAVAKAVQEAERRRAEEESKRQQQEMPYKLAQTYQNFNEVCSDENLDYLQYHYPEVYNTFKSAPDTFEKWGNVYKAVKRFVPNFESKSVEKKIEQNSKKPLSVSVPGSTPSGETIPYKLDEKRRMDNWTRMQRTMKGSSR